MITVLWILLALIVALMIWILVAPVFLIVDTSLGKYEVYQLGVFKISYHPGNTPLFALKIFGVRVELSRDADPTTTPSRKEKRRKTKSKKSIAAWLYLLKGIRDSFCIKRFRWKLDTDDPVLNAQLYAGASFINHRRAYVSINFVGENFLELVIRARVYRICWTIIRFLTKK